MPKTAEEKQAAMAEEQERLAKEFEGMSLKDLCGQLALRTRKLEKLKDECTEQQKFVDYIRIVAIPTIADEEGVTNLTFAYGKEKLRMAMTGDMHCGVMQGKQEDAFNWLRDNGHGDLVKPGVNPSSLKAALKQAMEKGEEVPPDLFKIAPFTRASITKVS